MKIFSKKQLDIRTTKGFSEFYNTYLNYTFSVCYRHLRDKEECKDILSKIFSSIWERRMLLNEQYQQHEGQWKDYLAKAVKLKIYDHLRKKERTDRYMQTSISENVSYVNSTHEEIAYNDLEERVNLLVEQLPPRCKEVYQLSRGQGMTNKEIALRLSITNNTVKTHLAKALCHLQEHLPEYNVPKRTAV